MFALRVLSLCVFMVRISGLVGVSQADEVIGKLCIVNTVSFMIYFSPFSFRVKP